MTLAVILAGGEGRRLGGCDKPLLPLGGSLARRTVLDELVCRLRPQVTGLAIATRHDQCCYDNLGLPVLRDPWVGKGPISGVLSALTWASERGETTVLTVPGDTPFIPDDLVSRLFPAPACAASSGKVHPLVALWPVSCLASLHDHLLQALATGNHRDLAIRFFAARLSMRHVVFDTATEDPFFNINTPEDVARLGSRDLSHQG